MFIINLIPLHVFVLLLMQRYSRRVYIGKTQTDTRCTAVSNTQHPSLFDLIFKMSSCTPAEMETGIVCRDHFPAVIKGNVCNKHAIHLSPPCVFKRRYPNI